VIRPYKAQPRPKFARTIRKVLAYDAVTLTRVDQFPVAALDQFPMAEINYRPKLQTQVGVICIVYLKDRHLDKSPDTITDPGWFKQQKID